MKNFAGTLLILLIFCMHAVGQREDMAKLSAEEIAERQTNRMKTDLNLTEEQIPKVQAINLEYAKKTKELFANEALSRPEKFQEMQVMNSNKEFELKKVFTKEQYKLFKAQQEERRKKMEEKKEQKEGNR